MFFGNMQSFYRRNSIHSPSSSRGPQSKPKDNGKHVRHTHKGENKEDEPKESPVRRKSFSISRNPTEYDEPVEDFNRTSVPVIKIGLYEPEPVKKSYNILKEKEKALWYNSCTESDNSVRLGPNRNNIIEDSLKQTD